MNIIVIVMLLRYNTFDLHYCINNATQGILHKNFLHNNNICRFTMQNHSKMHNSQGYSHILHDACFIPHKSIALTTCWISQEIQREAI